MVGVSSVVQCVLDRSVVNNDTIYKFTNLGLSIFAVLCGKNRGVFVTTHSDPGNTYSCLTLPPSFQNILSNSNIPMSTSNDIGMYRLGSRETPNCLFWWNMVDISHQRSHPFLCFLSNDRFAIQGREYNRCRDD